MHEHRSRRGFAMRSGDCNCWPLITDGRQHLCPGEERNCGLLTCRSNLDIRLRNRTRKSDRIATQHQCRFVSDRDFYAHTRQAVCGGRFDDVAACNGMTHLKQYLRDRVHARATNAHYMDTASSTQIKSIDHDHHATDSTIVAILQLRCTLPSANDVVSI